MKYDFSKEIDRQFEALRNSFENDNANWEEIVAMEHLMRIYGEHWNGEEWTYYLDRNPVYVRPEYEEWDDGDYHIVYFEFH